MLKHTLALALWLAFSWPCAAITFAFDVTGGDTDLVDFEATLDLDPVGRFFAASSVDSGEISSDGGFQRLELDYDFSGLARDILLTPTLFRVNNPAHDNILISLTSFSHSAIDFGFTGASDAGLFGDWTLDFLTDNPRGPTATLLGTFVQQVPEPGALGLVALGLVVTIRLSRRQTRLRDS